MSTPLSLCLQFLEQVPVCRPSIPRNLPKALTHYKMFESTLWLRLTEMTDDQTNSLLPSTEEDPVILSLKVDFTNSLRPGSNKDYLWEFAVNTNLEPVSAILIS